MKKYWMWLVVVLMGTHLQVIAQSCTDLATASDYETRGDTAYNQKLYNDALLDYGCAIQLDAQNASYYNARGTVYYWQGQDALARADFLKTVELDPTAGYAYNNLANLYSGIGDYDQALEYYNQAIQLDSGQTDITYINRANIYIETSEFVAAQADIDSALQVNPNYKFAYISQAWLYATQGESQLAAQNFYEWIQRIQIAQSTPQYQLNRSYVTRVQDGDVQNITLALNAGDVLSVSANEIDSDQRVDPLLVLLNPSGTPVIADDDSGVNLDAVVSEYVVPTSGSYTLLLSHAAGFYEVGVDGEVSLSIQVKAGENAVAGATPVESNNPTPVNDAGAAIVNGSFATFRLYANVTAEVYTTKGDRLNLRTGPGLRFDIVTKLGNGDFVTLVEGPRKQDGLAWWLVRTADGTQGWAVERVDQEQTLQMALIVGEDAYVTSGEDALNVRASAGRSAELLFQLADGTRVTLLEVAPELVDGFQWWHIRTPEGQDGWTIDRIEGERMLIPAKERE